MAGVRMLSPEYEEYVKDWQTRNYYDLMIPGQREAVRGGTGGHRIWVSDSDEDPWMKLFVAVVCQAAADYVEFVKRGDVFMLRQLEAWFTRTEETGAVLNRLNRMLRKVHTKRDLDRISRQIRTCL